jgi:hypothetical protein
MRTICRYRASLGRRIARSRTHSLLMRDDTEIDGSDWFRAKGLKQLRSLELDEISLYSTHSWMN